MMMTMESNKRSKKSIVGFDENAMRLLFNLMHLVVKDYEKVLEENDESENAFSGTSDDILQLFQAMDVDGDGNISWWEWKQILEAAVIMIGLIKARNHGYTFNSAIDLLDPLVITAESACAILKFQKGSIIRPTEDRNETHVLGEKSSSDDFLLSSTPSKTSFRLQEKINSLRVKNNKLQQKLDEALFASQFVANTSQILNGRDDILKETEEQTKQVQLLFEAERKRRIALEYEMNARENVNISSPYNQNMYAVSKMNRKQSHEELLDEINKQQKEIEDLRIKKNMQNSAATKLQRNFIKHHNNKITNEVASLNEKLENDISLLEMEKYKMQCIMRTQRVYRAHAARKRIQKIKNARRIICAAILRRKDKKKHMADVIVQQLTAVNKIQSIWDKHRKSKQKALSAKENKSASLIQSLYKSKYVLSHNLIM